jgi:uncharacterized protein YraI
LFALLKQARTGFFITMVGLMLTSIISPVMALAATDLVPGDDAVVLTDTRLYDETSRDANVTAEVAKDTPVSIVEGPFTADDSTQWYWVRVYEQTGYMPAIDLEGMAPAPAEEAPAETAATEAPATRPWQEPIDFGVASDNVSCRIDASTGSQELVLVTAGQTIEVTGQETWSEGIAWLPVNCAGVGGFIASDYIALDSATEVATEVVTETPTETQVATEVVTETPVATETQVATEVVTETQAAAPAETEATDAAAPAETEAAGDDAAPAETEAADDAAAPAEATEAVTAGPAGAPISVAIANDDVVCRVDVSIEATQITVFAAGQTVEITGAPVDAAGLSWTPVNCSGVGGFVASQFIDAGAADIPAEEATDEASPEPSETTDETATGEATEAPTEVATDAAATPAATDEAAAPAEEAADNATDEEATEEATDAAATPAATDEAATPTEEATEEPTEEATEEPADEEMLDSGQAVTESESTMPVEDSAIIGTATVRDTNGAGIACRTAADASAPIITVLPEGMSVLILSEPDANGWMSIVCNNEVGFAPVTYLWQGGAASDFTADQASYGNVTATGGAGLNCRSGPGTNHSVIGYFPAGSGINVRGAAQGDWVPVVCGGQNGWVHGDYLTPATAPGTTDPGTNPGTTDPGTGGTMVVSNTGGESLYCRATPGGTAITLMAEGTRVSVRGATEGGWVPIVCAGQNGFASAQYLTAEGGTTDPGTTDPGTNPGTTDPGTGGTVTVTGTGGMALNCRSTPNGSVIGSVREGTVLNVRGATEGGWVPVVCNGANGWVSALYVTAGGSTPAPNPDPTPSPTPSPSGFANGDHARTTDALNLRYEPSPGAGVATYAPAGTVILITGGHAGNGYYPVNWDGLSGYMHGDYLVKTDEALSKRGGSGNPTTPPPTNGGGGGSATGNALVDYAMGYVGYPYVWATHGPSSFDCSGFTYWVVKNVTGKNIGTGTWSQVSAGPAVSRNALQPGDLVFFQNTYTSGLSHVGLYIGGDQFVHAQNESTGVVVSSLNSSYYASRWYGAVRVV